jgi:hypothetical protein
MNMPYIDIIDEGSGDIERERERVTEWTIASK